MKLVSGGDPRILEQYFAMLADLAEHPPFPIHGLREPVLTPGFLAEFGREDEAWGSVTLVYGDRDVPQGPLVTVRTGPPGSATGAEDGREALLAALSDESKVEVDPGEPHFSPLPGGGAGQLCRLGGVWALRVSTDAQLVTVVGRGLEPEAVRVGPVADLRPYVAEREALRQRHAARRRARPVPEPAPATGIAAVRALAQTCLPGGPDAGEAHRPLWRRATAELAKAAGCGEERADFLLTSLINQLGHLRRYAGWFIDDTRLREAAFEETLRHAVLGQPVPSRDAQQAWERYWEQQDALDRVPLEARAQALRNLRENLRPRWLDAWQAWATGRGGGPGRR